MTELFKVLKEEEEKKGRRQVEDKRSRVLGAAKR